MTVIRRFADWLWLRGENPEVVTAQLLATRGQLPLLYIVLCLNAGAVTYTNYNLAPQSLTIWLFSALLIVGLMRIINWVSPRSCQNITPQIATQRLRYTMVLSTCLSLGFSSWAMALDRFAGPLEQGHIAMFLSMSMIGCIFGLVYLPQAALLVACVGTVPYLGYYLSKDSHVFTAIAFNLLLVTSAMLMVVMNNFQRFRQVILARGHIDQKQREAEKLSAENARLAHTDSLTGLPNRRSFIANLQYMIDDRRDSRLPFVVGMLDLDSFKPVNDTFGHKVGDMLLARIGQRLQMARTANMTIARLGGDEFGILIDSPPDSAEAAGEELCRIVAEPYEIGELNITIGCSCGIAIFPDAGVSAHELFDRSDYALYHSKTFRRNGCTVFSVDHETRIRSSRATEVALQNANFKQEMDVHFQPIIDIDTGRALSFEALARWKSPFIGAVPPAEFISTAERLGTIHKLSLHLLERTLHHARVLPDHVGVSFNLSAADIAAQDTIDSVMAIIAASGIRPSNLTMELTETALMRDFDQAKILMQRMQAMGVRMALDDFGTGYSSLGYLRQLPLDVVKVDRSFIGDLHSEAGRKILVAIGGLCRNLGLGYVIEGVENHEQLLHVRALGYRVAQGYLFAKPMPIDQTLTWLAQHEDTQAEEETIRLASNYAI